MRRPLPVAAGLLALALTAGCTGGGGTAEPVAEREPVTRSTTSAPATPDVVPSPTGTAVPTPSPTTATPTPTAPAAPSYDVAAVQRTLTEQKYYVGAVDGKAGPALRSAVMAFQKVNGLGRDGIVGPRTRAALANPRAPEVRSNGGDVMEVNEGTQVLTYVRDGRVLHIFNTSTGTEGPYVFNGVTYTADTPNGQFEVNRQIDGWRVSRLGRLYRPKYFHPDGIAIHGSTDVPPYPASHGCVRVSIPAMDFLWPRIAIGTDVWVY